MPSMFEAAEYFEQLLSILVIELPRWVTPSAMHPGTCVLAILGTRETKTETCLNIPTTHDLGGWEFVQWM